MFNCNELLCTNKIKLVKLIFHMIKNKRQLTDVDLNLRKTLFQIFSFINYEFKSAVNGKEALELLEN